MSLNNVRRTVIKNKLEQLFLTKSFFDICLVREVLKMGNMELSMYDNEELKPFHCVQWSDMGKDGEFEFKQHLVKLFKRYLGADSEIKDADYEVVVQQRLSR